MEIELVGGAVDGRRITVRGEATDPCPYVLIAEHLPLRTEDGEQPNVEAVLASFQVVRYDRVKEPGAGGGSRPLYRRRREPAA